MATINNTKGTSYPSFTIGKRGITIHQSAIAPDNALGNDGDLYVERGVSAQKLHQKIGGSWTQIQVSNANLAALSGLTPVNNQTLGTNASGFVLRDPASQRATLGLGDAAVLNTGTAAGNIPVLDGQGKLAATIMPEISITRVYTVADNTERDALDVQTGDVSIVTASGDTFIYDGADWKLIGVAGSVSAIQGPNGTSKSGVVSLAATDILSGVFDVSQGGTGLISYAPGDLLVGSASGALEKLNIGLADQILAIKSGKPAWTTLTAQTIPFSANAANNISATNIGDAILEAAAERAYIMAATSNPTLNDDATSNLKAGDIWINTQAKRVFVAASTTANSAQWNEVLTPLLPGNVFFIGTRGSDVDSDGSLGNPWATIGHALTVAPSGSTLVLFEGQYNETLSIAHNSLTLKAIGDVQLTGKITITGQDFVAEDVKFISSAAEAVELSGSARVKIKGGSIKNVSNANLSLKISGTIAAGNEFHDVLIGNVSVASTTTTPVKIFNGSVGKVQIDTGSLIISNSDSVGQVNHDGGFLQINGVRVISSLSSTAASGSDVGLILENVSFKDAFGTYGTLTKSGDCAFELNDVDWFKTTDLSGTRTFGRLARDIWADFTPTAYTVAGVTVKNHLEGIDAKLATLGSASTFQDLSDAADYTPADADKVLKVNSSGTGIDFGLVLGSAASAETTDFATAAQGVLANTAVQPGSLATVATSGLFSDLTDVPDYSNTDAGKVLKINATGTGLELGVASGDKIFTGTTSVQTNEVTNKVTVNANGQLVATFDDNGVSLSGTGNTALISGPGEAITIHPGDAVTGAGASLSISGGNATESGQAGGHLILSPGTPGSGGLAAQVKLASGYVPTSADSVVNKSYVDSRVTGNASITIVTAAGNYTADTTDSYVLIKKTTGAATQVTLPSAPATGKIITIKDAKGDAATNNITIVAASGTIDGQASVVIAYNYEAISLLYNGTEWNLI